MADDGDKVAMFIEITGSSDANAIQMLESTGWNVEEAVQLFFASGGGADVDTGAFSAPSSSAPAAPGPVPAALGDSNWASGRRDPTGAAPLPTGSVTGPPAAALAGASDDDVRAPLPVRREALYGPTGYVPGAVPGSSTNASLLAAAQYGLPQQQGLVPPNPFAVSQGQVPHVDAFRDFAQEAADRDAARTAAAAAAAAGEAEGAEAVTGASRQAARASQANLASLYKPPTDLLFKGGFEEAKSHAMGERRWLLVNLQSNTEFASHVMPHAKPAVPEVALAFRFVSNALQLNRDIWANEMVKNMVSTYFVLWQVYENTVEGRKICTYYNLHSAPVTMVINPRTGQRQKSWEGAVGAEQLLEDLMPFIDEPPSGSRTGAPPPQKKPREKDAAGLAGARGFEELGDLEEDEQLRMALAASLEPPTSSAAQVPKHVEHAEGLGMALHGGPPAGTSGAEEEPQKEKAKVDKGSKLDLEIPEEPPRGAEGTCAVAFRLPEGRRISRRFFLSDSVQVLKLFCQSQVPDAPTRAFQLTPALPGSAPLDFTSAATIGDLGLGNSLLALTWL